jgi:hypothetical protein
MRTEVLVTARRKDNPQEIGRTVWGKGFSDAMRWIERHEARHGGGHIYQVKTRTLVGNEWQITGESFFTTNGVEITEAQFVQAVKG